MSGLQMRARVRERGLDVELEVADGEVVALLGANGSGKSTVLSVIAGLLRPDSGRVTLDDDVLYDGRVDVPPHRRGVVLLAQQALLFPHLSVAGNVAFGPRARGASRPASRAAAVRWLAEVGATELAGRRPAGLSGGEAQRVALARALAARPRLLLLDEPMGALDVATVPALRQLLGTVLSPPGRSAIIVTHDVLDALVLADRVVVMQDGRVAEQGVTREVLTRPRSVFAARLAGLNLLTGTLSDAGLVTADGRTVAGVPELGCRPGGPGVAVFPPSAVAVYLDAPAGGRTVLPTTIGSVEPVGNLVRVRASDTDGPPLMADLTPVAAAELELVPGRRVCFVVTAAEVSIHAA